MARNTDLREGAVALDASAAMKETARRGLVAGAIAGAVSALWNVAAASVGSAAAWLQESLDSLRVDTARMAATVAAAAEPQLAAAAADALAGSLGRGEAHDVVARCVRTARDQGRPLIEVLGERADLDPAALSALAAGPDVGEAAAQVDAVLSHHHRVVHGES